MFGLTAILKAVLHFYFNSFGYRLVMRHILILIVLVFAGPAHADISTNPVEIKEWKIPSGGRSRDPFAHRLDAVWFAGQAGNYLGRLNPQTDDIFIRYLDDEPGPHNLTVDAGGMVWYSGNLSGYIGRYDPVLDTIEKITLPEEAYDPHTLVFDYGEKTLWFTAQNANVIGRLSPKDHKIDIVALPDQFSRPYGIAISPSGVPWIAVFGSNHLVSVDPETLKLTTVTLPDDARPRRIDVTSDGTVWYVDYRRGYLGRLKPIGSDIKEWSMPSGSNARPYGMAVDSQNNIWFVETGISPNLFVGFNPKSEKFFSITPIPSGGGSVRHMHFQKETGQVWFGTDENTIGRAQVEAR